MRFQHNNRLFNNLAISVRTLYEILLFFKNILSYFLYSYPCLVLNTRQGVLRRVQVSGFSIFIGVNTEQFTVCFGCFIGKFYVRFLFKI